eukprot:801475_1
MSLNTAKEISPLLKNNNAYSTYNEDITCIRIDRQSHSMSKSSKSSTSKQSILSDNSAQHTHSTTTIKYHKQNPRMQIKTNIHNNNQNNNDNSFKICLGRFLKKCEPCTKRLKIGYYVILTNAVVV